jgi:hypothetical protein
MRRRGSLIAFSEPDSKHQLRARAKTLDSGKVILVALANVRPELRIGVGVEISGPKEYYDAFEKDKANIRSELNGEQELLWEPKTKVRDIWLYRSADFFERKLWPEQHEWLRHYLEAFQRTLKPRIRELLGASS